MQQADNGFSVCDTWLPMITLYSDDPDTLRQLDERDGATWTDQAVVDSLTLYQRTIDEGLWQGEHDGDDNTACLNAMYAGAGAAYYRFVEPPTFYADGPPEPVERLKVMKTPTLEAGGRHWTGNRPVPPTPLWTQPEQGRRADVHAVPLLAEVYTGDDRFVVDARHEAAAELVTDPLILTMASAA